MPAESPSRRQIFCLNVMSMSAGTESRSRSRPWFVFRLFLSGWFMLLGIAASVILIALAAVLPQIPRQRAIALVESRGGELSYNTTFPTWAYESFGEERLRRFDSVYEINLDGADVDDAVLARLVELKEANIVWLNSATITDRGGLLLASFSSITSLDLGNTRLTERSIVPILEQHTRLEIIWLQNTEAGDESLRALSGAKSLQNLSIYNTRITDEGLAHLSGLPLLASLDIDNTNVGDDGIAHLGGCRSLSDLTLANTHVEGPGLAPLGRLRSLRSLNLTGTPVGDEGARCLSASTSLRDLHLDGTNITDAGLEHLAKITSLSTLSLNGVEITDEGLRHLHSMTNLRELYIGSSQVTPEAIAELRAALPDCSVNGSSEELWAPMSGGSFF